MQKYSGYQYTPAPQTEWDKLPMSEKTDIIKVCVPNGITSLQDIRTAYNNYKGGRNIFEGISDHSQKASEFGHFLATGRHVYDGTHEDTQKMQIGKDYWQLQTPQSFFSLDFPVSGGTLQEIVVTGSKKKYEEERKQRLAKMREILNRQQRDYLTESNDNTWVENRDPRVQASRLKNPHLSQRTLEGAKAHAAWEEEHPNLTAWGNLAGALPFAIAAYPLAATVGSGVAAIGDAAAATTVGQGITNFLTPIATSTIAGAPTLEWANVGLSSLSAAHGLQEAINGNFSPMSALEIAPMLQVAKPMTDEAVLAIENYRYPLGRPQVPEGYLTIKPQTRTRIGDVEVDNPNLLYHLDRGDGSGAFSTQGAYITNGKLFPGTPKDASDIPYSWWNEGKPYSTSVKGQPMTRLMTATKDTPGMLHVRSQNYPIGQWNGKKGFVLNSEYVNPEGVNVSGSTYTLDPNYGWRKVFDEGSTVQWSEILNSKPGDPTDNLLRWLGNPLDQKVNVSAEVYLNNRYSPEYQRMVKMLQDHGVDLSRVSVSDLTKIINKRMQELQKSAPERYSIARPAADRHFSIADFVRDRNYPIGETNLTIGDDGTAYMENVVNYTRNSDNPLRGVQERSLNSAINISNSVGGDGVVTGREYLSAPRQYHVVQKFRDRKVLDNVFGEHSNTNMVTDYKKKYGLYDDYSESVASSILDLARAGEHERKVLFNAPVWKLSTPTFNTPTKSILFDPSIINNEGRMIIDWRDPNIFRSFGGQLYTKK